MIYGKLKLSVLIFCSLIFLSDQAFSGDKKICSKFYKENSDYVDIKGSYGSVPLPSCEEYVLTLEKSKTIWVYRKTITPWLDPMDVKTENNDKTITSEDDVVKRPFFQKMIAKASQTFGVLSHRIYSVDPSLSDLLLIAEKNTSYKIQILGNPGANPTPKEIKRSRDRVDSVEKILLDKKIQSDRIKKEVISIEKTNGDTDDSWALKTKGIPSVEISIYYESMEK